MATKSENIEHIKLEVDTGKRIVRVPAVIERADGRIKFLQSPFALKDEIKAMDGAKWHGFEDPPQKIWSVKDSERNNFQLAYMQGEDVYSKFDGDPEKREYRHPLMDHQKDLCDAGLARPAQIFAAMMGFGKSLSAQVVIEETLKEDPNAKFWWVGPKSSLPNMLLEFKKWDFNPSGIVEMMTYDGLVTTMDKYTNALSIPRGIIFDESQKLKNYTSQRSKAAALICSLIREKYGDKSRIIMMSGTPSPKSPVDWWSQCEIACPGFLKEGSPTAFKRRLAISESMKVGNAMIQRAITWRDNEDKCDKCGVLKENHHFDPTDEGYHDFIPSVNEVAYLYERLKGLATIKMDADALNLPDKVYRVINVKPSQSLMRVAQAIRDTSPNAMVAMSKLRELSDGFQYQEKVDGEKPCDHCEDGTVTEWFLKDDEERCFTSMDLLPELEDKVQSRTVKCPQCNGTKAMPRVVRKAKMLPCPKDNVLRDLLEESEDVGRIIIFAAFTGTIDKAVNICQKEGWTVVRLDGRGYHVVTPDDEIITGINPLEYWKDMSNEKVAFIAHPESGSESLTLVEAKMMVFLSNTHKPNNRIQAEARFHRKGAVGTCTVVDIFHLPSDSRVLDLVRDSRRLELMTMNEVFDCVDFDESDE